MLITYQFVEVPNTAEQVPLLHQAAWNLLKKSLQLGQKHHLVPNINQWVLTKNQYQKPYFRDYPNLYFNLSHTLGCVACIIASCEVGIDIEKIRPFPPTLIPKVCTPLEQNWLYQQPCPNQAFFRLWTAKEAVLKAKGTGINQSLKNVAFLPDATQILHPTLMHQTGCVYQAILNHQFVLSTCIQNHKTTS